MTTHVWTWLPDSTEPVLAAHLNMDAGQGRFCYEQTYMDTPNARALDPLQLRFSRKSRGIAMLQDGGLPGVVADAMPAGYRADCLQVRHDRKLTPLELLEFGPPDGVGAIEVCHDIARKRAWQPHTLDELRAHIQELETPPPPAAPFSACKTTTPPARAGSAPNSPCNTRASCGWL